MTTTALVRQARSIIAMQDSAHSMGAAMHGLALEHRFLCHGDGSACGDGCDVAAVPARMAALEAAASPLVGGHACESVGTADGHGAFCRTCGETLA